MKTNEYKETPTMFGSKVGVRKAKIPGTTVTEYHLSIHMTGVNERLVILSETQAKQIAKHLVGK